MTCCFALSSAPRGPSSISAPRRSACRRSAGNSNDGTGIGPLPFADGKGDDAELRDEARRRTMLEKAAAYQKAKATKTAYEQAVEASPDGSVDDIDPGPTDEGKVLLFGGWLDEDVAGQRKADDGVADALGNMDLSMLDTAKEYDLSGTPADSLRKSRLLAQAFFTQGNRFFEKGRYARAEKFFSKASSLVGMQTREGGQYELWVAQARDARGDKTGAKALLQMLSKHSDADVKRVAEELDFILTAPSLNLPEGSFIKMDLDKDVRVNKARKYGTLNPRGADSAGYAQVEKAPEKYSIEWFLAQPAKTPIGSFNVLVLASIAAITVVLLLLAYGPT